VYLETDFPHVHRLSELRRNPHLLSWIRGLSQEDPPSSPYARRIYLTVLRRLFRDLAPEAQPGLILLEDVPPPQPRANPKRIHGRSQSAIALPKRYPGRIPYSVRFLMLLSKFSQLPCAPMRLITIE